MNKRIQKLAKQAGFGLRRDGEIYTSRLEHLPITEDLAKFAELIVMECTKILADNGEFRGCVIIGKHFRVFGVEE
jgi:hypothetical protein